VLLVSIAGCGGASADSLVKDQIKHMNDFADALEKNDKARAEAAKKGMEDTNKRLEDLKLPEAEKKKVVEANKDALSSAMTRLMTAAMKTELKDIKLPGGDTP
jgi:hypothetical protein